jgi:hypothetical protein
MPPPACPEPPPLYPAAEGTLDPAAFVDPPAIYRGTPFWSWNSRLDRARLLGQLDDLKAMGMGGAHIHSRTGLATPYLGPEFMDCVRASLDHAITQGLKIWLYDEDRWPSGFAGGLATREERHRLRYLLFTPRSYAQDPGSLPGPSSRAERWRTGRGQLLARYALRFERGMLTEARVLEGDADAGIGDEVWFAYLEVCPPTSWYNHAAPLDVLSRDAVEHFISTTHEVYRGAVGHEFGKAIPAMFTDEPLFTGKTEPAAWDDRADQWLPWTDDLAETLRAAHGTDIVPCIPALFFDGLEDTARTRWCWHDHVAERFRQAFSEPIAAWCGRNGLHMTGHLESEGSLASQTARSGECMRFYQPMHLPGIDMLCDAIELSTAIQARSVARQEGRPGVMSELYGVTNWDFDFTGHKRQGDWQAALGITVRVHHLAWYSMAGEAKRDYPAAIDSHSPWFAEYPLIENHFARLNTCLTRGRARTRVAIVHPIESVWIHWGQRDRNGAAREAHEERFQSLIRWLLHGLIDVDFIAESLLPRQEVAVTADGRLQVGDCRYDAVLVPGLSTIRGTTLDVLERFAGAGGRVAFLGAAPALVDALPDPRAKQVAAECAQITCERVAVLGWLNALRDIRARGVSGPPRSLLHQLREEGDDRWLFLCETSRTQAAGRLKIELRGDWACERWDTVSGQIAPLTVTQRDGWSGIDWDAPAAGSILLRWKPASTSPHPADPDGNRPADAAERMETGAWESSRRHAREIGRLADPESLELAEPNVLLLDQAEGSLDGNPFEPLTEVLRLDNQWRVRLGWGRITSRIAQPWAESAGNPEHRVRLRYHLDLEVPVRDALLALERADEAAITIDGNRVSDTRSGWWVDPDIATVPLPPLAAGRHTLEIEWPYGRDRTLEWAYLLGTFGVRIAGRRAIVTALPERWTWGDLTGQGLPFYGGNRTYRCRFDHPGGPLRIRVPVFGVPLLRVALDGVDRGPLAFPPYELDLGDAPAGTHTVEIVCFGDRYASFGQLHHARPWRNHWWGPDSWRTDGDDWADEYRTKPHGILAAPILLGAHP